MSNGTYITSYCSINKDRIITHGTADVVSGFADYPSLIKELYVKNGIQYPKFYKMDNLSKLAFVTSEMLISGTNLKERYSDDSVGVFLTTAHSSLDTDCRYAESIRDDAAYYPSPSIFVYTLPNIMIGEICIRNAFRGENNLFINGDPSDEMIINYVSGLFSRGKIKACIFGSVDLFLSDFSSHLFLIETGLDKYHDTNKISGFNAENIKKLMKNSN